MLLGEIPLNNWILEYFALSKKKSKPIGILPFGIESSFRRFFFLIACSMCFTKCHYRALMTFCSLCIEPCHIPWRKPAPCLWLWEAHCKQCSAFAGEELCVLWRILLKGLEKNSWFVRKVSEWRWEGKGKEQRPQSTGLAIEGLGPTAP